ncbi:MAG: cupin domain-containing protein [Caldilineaceae bacterium]
MTQANQQWLNTLTGHNVRIKTHGDATSDQLCIIEYVEGPHTMPPVFTRHAFIEAFHVLDGALIFQFLDEEPFEVAAGSTVTCPPWKPHSFWNQTDEPVRALLICTPAGLERFFEESSALIAQMPPAQTPPDIMQTAMKALRDKYGLEHVGAPPALK